jgi:hypothetical protein
MQSTATKIISSIFLGLIVTGFAAGTRFLLTHDVSRLSYVGDAIAGLVAMLIALALHLRYESQYYKFALERAVVFSEINHHVRNAVFPLCLAVQASGDQNSIRMSDEAIARLNMVLREAITDVFSHKVQNPQPGKQTRRVAA